MANVIDRDLGYKQLMRELQGLSALAVTVGLHEGDVGGVEDVAAQAAINEFGSSDGIVPERPAWRSAFDAHQDAYVRGIAVAVRKATQGADARSALAALGHRVKRDIAKSITDWETPPNAELTVAKKGFDDPLIETGFTKDALSVRIGGVKTAAPAPTPRARDAKGRFISTKKKG